MKGQGYLEAITLEEARELYCNYNWSMELVYKCLVRSNPELTLPAFSRLVIERGWNEIHNDKQRRNRSSIEKNHFFKSDLRTVRNEDEDFDMECFFGGSCV